VPTRICKSAGWALTWWRNSVFGFFPARGRCRDASSFRFTTRTVNWWHTPVAPLIDGSEPRSPPTSYGRYSGNKGELPFNVFCFVLGCWLNALLFLQNIAASDIRRARVGCQFRHCSHRWCECCGIATRALLFRGATRLRHGGDTEPRRCFLPGAGQDGGREAALRGWLAEPGKDVP
jgi:hypothetical protein